MQNNYSFGMEKENKIEENRIEKKNIQQFVDFFRNGCKENHTEAIGIEIEHFVVNAQDKSAISYYGEKGIEALLERLSPCFAEKGIKEGHLVGLGNPQYVVSIEPAAQLEISIAPQSRIQDMEHIYQDFRQLIDPILTEWGYELAATGYCLKEKSEDLPLIPKNRYKYMDRYFEEIGMYGRCMMRGTASVQCAIDYYSEEDFVNTYRAAVALGPLLALVTDNAGVFQGEPWDKHMVRTFIWENVDKDRCGVVPGTFCKDFGFEAYGRYLYQAPLIFLENEALDGVTGQEAGEEQLVGEDYESGKEQYVGDDSLQRLCRDKEVTQKQMEHAMSIVFPDVRLKQYMEIRIGDSMPMEYALSYAALIKGLFQNRDKLHEFYKQLCPLQGSEGELLPEQYTGFGGMTEEEVTAGKIQLIEHGYDGIIYGRTAGYWLEKMVELAGTQLPQEEQKYLALMQELVANRKSVRDRMEELL